MSPRRFYILWLSSVAVAAAAGASVTVSPGSVTVHPGEATPWVTVQLTFPVQGGPGTGSLEITPPAPLVGHASIEPDPTSYSWSLDDTSATLQFRILTEPGAPAGTWTFPVIDQTLGAGQATFRLTIVAPSFTGSVTPQPVSLVAGGRAERLVVRTLPGNGLAEPVRWAVEGLPGFLHAGPAAVSSPPAYAPVELELAAGARARPGSYSGRVRGTATGLAPIDLPLTVEVREPDFTPRPTPTEIELVPGGPSVRVSVATRAPGVETGTIAYEIVGLPPGVVSSGPRTSGGPGFPPVDLLLSATPAAAPGTVAARLRGTLRPAGVVREVPLRIVVRRPAPRITGVAPMRLASGALAQEVAVLGTGFDRDATVAVQSAAVRVGAARVVSDARIELSLDVRPDAPAGTVPVVVTNPDGQATPQPGLLTVVDGDSPAAPLAVRTVAVLSPLAGAQVGLDERLEPRGVLAVSGSGAVVVSWLLDGVPFDRSVVQARGGEPVEVKGAPIPPSGLGVHELQLVVEDPSRLAGEPVPLFQVVTRSSALRPLAPDDGAAVERGTAPRLSWTLVPGAVGYRVELLDEEDAVRAVWQATDAELVPSAEELDALPAGTYRWRVRPRFAADVLGEPGPARTLRLGAPPGAPGSGAGGRASLPRAPAARRPGFSLAGPPGAPRPLALARLASWTGGASGGGTEAPGAGESDGGEAGDGAPDVGASRDRGPGEGASGVGGPDLDGTEESYDEVGGGWEETGWTEAEETGSDWDLGLELGVNGADGDGQERETSATLAASGAGETRTHAGGELKATAELSLAEALEGETFDDENRSWLLETGRAFGPARGSLGVGYGSSDLLAGSELVSAGLSTGGARAGLRAGAVDVTAYATFDDDLQGVVSAVEGPTVDVSGAAVEIGRDRSFRLGAAALEGEREGDLFTPASKGSLLALLAAWSGRLLDVTLEAARSDEDGREGETGDALRLAVGLRAGAWDVELGLRSIDPGFEHPAAPGLSLSGVPDRRGGTLRVGRSWSGGNLGLGVSRLESDGDPESGSPAARRSEASLDLYQSLSERVTLTLSGNRSSTDADAVDDFLLPASELDDVRVALGLQESLGLWSLGQQLSRETTEDALDPERFSETTQAGLDLARAGPVFGLWGQLGAVRTRAGVERWETTQTLASLQPSWRLERAGLSLQPYLSWSRTRDDLSPEDLTMESYRMAVSWSPPRLRSFTVQATGDWSRSRGGGFSFGDGGFAARYTLSIGWHGRLGIPRASGVSGPDAFAGAALPATLSDGRLGV